MKWLPGQAARTERQKLVEHLVDHHGVAIGSAARMTMVQAERRHAKEHRLRKMEERVPFVLVRAAKEAWMTSAQVRGASGLSLYKVRKLLQEMVDAGTVEEVQHKGRWYYRVVDEGGP